MDKKRLLKKLNQEPKPKHLDTHTWHLINQIYAEDYKGIQALKHL